MDVKKSAKIPSKLKFVIFFFGILQFILSINHLGTVNSSNFGQEGIAKYSFAIQSLSDNTKTFLMNPDEESNYRIALNATRGLGYTYWNGLINQYVPSSWHSPQTVFLYEALINAGIDFDFYIISYLLVASLGHCCALIAIYKLIDYQGSKWGCLGVLTWALFPPTLYYINTLFFYESLTTSLLVVFIYLLSLAQRLGELSIRQYTMITLTPLGKRLGSLRLSILSRFHLSRSKK